MIVSKYLSSLLPKSISYNQSSRNEISNIGGHATGVNVSDLKDFAGVVTESHLPADTIASEL